MSRLLFAAFALLLAAPLATAQEAEPPFTADARALLFQIGPDLRLSSLSGATGAMKWHRSPTRATRLGLTLAFDAEVEDQDSEIRDESVSRQGTQLATTLLFLSYAEPRTPIRLYRGLGPTASVQFGRVAQTVEPNAMQQVEVTQSTLGVSAGLGGALGAEWAVHPAIGLTAEYSTTLTVVYSRRSQSTNQVVGGVSGTPQEAVSDKFGVRLQPGGARLGLSVYF